MTSDFDTQSAPSEEMLRALWQEAHDLIKRLEGSTVQRLSIQAGQYKIEIERGAVSPAGTASAGGVVPVALSEGAAAASDNRITVLAPLVGTFYRSAQPGARPLVEIGDVVDPGQPVAIVEAMKIMNQIVAERRGRVTEILLKDGDWVEFQQVLIYLEPIES
ncbi:MAG: acetyl-CoA carboxylase biotin carboxyl carrier protein [Dehalococcoidia bacterium]